MKTVARFGWVLVVIGATGCGRYVIEGTVTDRAGQGLPGVSVQVEDSAAQAVTDGVGRFRIRNSGSETTVVFAKSGYAPARESVNRSRNAGEEPRRIALWKLPPHAGVFAFYPTHYAETTRVQPNRFYLSAGGTIRGTRRAPELTLPDLRPMLVCYQTPRYDALLSRLRPSDAKLLGESSEDDVWVESGGVKPALEPLDGSDGRLLSIRLAGDLEPGIYAVHWGALESDSALDSRAYLFEIVEPPPVEEAPEDPAPLAELPEPAAAPEILEPSIGAATPPPESGIIEPPMESLPDVLEPDENLEGLDEPALEEPADPIGERSLEELEALASEEDDASPERKPNDLDALEPLDPE